MNVYAYRGKEHIGGTKNVKQRRSMKIARSWHVVLILPDAVVVCNNFFNMNPEEVIKLLVDFFQARSYYDVAEMIADIKVDSTWKLMPTRLERMPLLSFVALTYSQKCLT